MKLFLFGTACCMLQIPCCTRDPNLFHYIFPSCKSLDPAAIEFTFWRRPQKLIHSCIGNILICIFALIGTSCSLKIDYINMFQYFRKLFQMAGGFWRSIKCNGCFRLLSGLGCMPGSSESDTRFFSLWPNCVSWVLFCSCPKNLQHIDFRNNYQGLFWSHTISWIFQPQWEFKRIISY